MNYLFLVLLLIDLFHLNYSSMNDYTPLYHPSSKRLFITNPCQTNHPSILIRNHSLYQFDGNDQQWKQVFISEKLFPKQVSWINRIDSIEGIFRDRNCTIDCVFKRWLDFNYQWSTLSNTRFHSFDYRSSDYLSINTVFQWKTSDFFSKDGLCFCHTLLFMFSNG